MVTVSDHGPGIDPANLSRVFDRFFPTESARDGTGLGLAIVKSVAVGHGGSVSVEATPGSGVTFRWVLPTP